MARGEDFLKTERWHGRLQNTYLVPKEEMLSTWHALVLPPEEVFSWVNSRLGITLCFSNDRRDSENTIFSGLKKREAA